MKASRFQALVIILKNIFITFWISVIVIYRAYRNAYSRRHCDQLLHWWSSKLLEFVNLSYEVFNPNGVRFEPNRRYVIMSNHSSLYDIPLTFMALPGSIRMLTKKELFEVPIWGRGMAAGEFISIDRNNRRQAFRDLQEARKKMESGIILWVAPEGTRSRTGKLGPFKKGGFMLALQTGATIVPVGIRGANEVLPAKTTDLHVGCHAEFHVGRPIDTSRYSKKQINELMEEVENQIRELAALPR
ncbi:lysophospholipid acyltransferase family protein [Desulforhabdus amnigena]|uniref:1-acyl-sn-glycerol-3-phosphate acyltransferase n=1 Tax=Desulforhabdus amnigena TaxID=40218 RepID=A0A9W6FRP0_9BACT|nr:lysophospholipid acyltransferase family protein [Desulforhabdus amnigena]GLI33737.1 1-acyl-sn-glycerol-3-phosphate acyltransferase [Desulforhabdus amnigena]